MGSIKKQAALSEGNLASLQANMESIMRNRELTETRMMQALREELSSAERRAEEERSAHNATKMAAMEREVELEHRALDASTTLDRIQRTADERTTKTVELEQKVALLEVECASLNQELQDMEVRHRRGQKKSPEEANQVIQITLVVLLQLWTATFLYDAGWLKILMVAYFFGTFLNHNLFLAIHKLSHNHAFSTPVGGGMHPMAGHFISEHYVFMG